MMEYVKESARNTPVIANTEVLVIGGGSAGVSAAVAAARSGSKVILVERDNYLGGLATGGYVLLWQGFNKGGSHTYGGLTTETTRSLEKLEGVYYESGHDFPYAFVDPELLKYCYQKMVLDSGVELWQGMLAVGVISEDNRVRAVLFEGKAGRVAIKADFVVDATGDGDVIAWSGAEFLPSSLPVSFTWTLGGVNSEKVNEDRAAFWRRYQQLVKEVGGPIDNLWPLPMREVWWCNGAYFRDKDPLNPEDLTQVSCLGREKAVSLLGQLKKSFPQCSNSFLAQTCTHIGVRVARQLRGVYTLTSDDARESREFSDSVGVIQMARDPGARPSQRVYEFEVPYRTLISNSVTNLVVAGRCISVSPGQNKRQGVLEDIRIIPSCMVTGQAAGCAVSLASLNRCTIQQVEIRELQKTLIGQQARIHSNQ